MILGAGYAGYIRLTKYFTIDEKDIYISYLPAVHSYEQVQLCVCFLWGMRIGFYSGSPLKLMEDMQILKPTAFASVPRLYNRIFGKIQEKFKGVSGIGKFFLDHGLKTKLENE